MKQILILKHIKYILTLKSLTIIILFSITNLFAAEEGKEPDKIKSSAQLTEILNKLYENCSDRKRNTIGYHGWNQEAMDTAQALISAKADPNISYYNEHSLLSVACLKNNIPLIETCLYNGAQIQVKATTLHYARSVEAIQLLLNAGADVNVKIPHQSNQQILHIACELHYPLEAIEALCNHTRSDSMSLDLSGYTPLHCLCSTADSEKANNVLLKAAALIWWSSRQVIVLDRIHWAPQTPRDLLEKTAPHLTQSFDAIVKQTKHAKTQFPHLAALPLRTFDQHMEQIEKPAFKAVETFITGQLKLSISISNIILGYNSRDTPQPTYPALVLPNYADKDTPGPTYSRLNLANLITKYMP